MKKFTFVIVKGDHRAYLTVSEINLKTALKLANYKAKRLGYILN
jgi:hypothetical protein